MIWCKIKKFKFCSTLERVCRNILKGELESINITIEVMPINTQMIGSYQTDHAFRAEFQQYLNNLFEGHV